MASFQLCPLGLPSVVPQEHVLGAVQVAALKLWVCGGSVEGSVAGLVVGLMMGAVVGSSVGARVPSVAPSAVFSVLLVVT